MAMLAAAAVSVGSGVKAIAAQPVGAGAGAKICASFTSAEVGKYLGTIVARGKVGGPLDSLCQWQTKSGQGFVTIQISSPRHWEAPDLADGFKRVSGIGQAAFVVPQFSGWEAGAQTATNTIYVSGRGGTFDSRKALEPLRIAVSRLSASR